MVSELKRVFAECGIAFEVVRHFRGAPVQGFIKLTDTGRVILCLTIRGKSADKFWFSLFHEVGHLINFEGIVCPDFSTYQDFPKPLKQWNYYRINAFGHWYGVILERYVVCLVRWGSEENFSYCFDGKPKNSMLLVSTVGGNPRKLCNRIRFEKGLREMVKRLSPHTILDHNTIFKSADIRELPS